MASETTPIYERRLQQDLEHLRGQLRVMGDMAEQMLQNALHALLTHDAKLANETVLSDHQVNRCMREVDRLSHAFIARHQPSAGHLRRITSILRLNVALERIGDYAVTIARESLQLSQPLSRAAAQEIETIGSEVREMLHRVLAAFYDGDEAMTRTAMPRPERLEITLNGIYERLIDSQYASQQRDKFAIFAILAQLKRVADHAKNICEDNLFALTGEIKGKKVYSLLFVDEDNACMGPMAQAIAAANHPGIGHYASAGSRPAAQADAHMLQFMAELGIPLDQTQPALIDGSERALARHQVIISLAGDPRRHIPTIPFHTAFIEWELGQPPAADDPAPQQRLTEIHRELAFRIAELMKLLRGDDPA
jgi:phosphate transport system protein